MKIEIRSPSVRVGCLILFDNLALSYVSLNRSRCSQVSLDKFEKFIRCVGYAKLLCLLNLSDEFLNNSG